MPTAMIKVPYTETVECDQYIATAVVHANADVGTLLCISTAVRSVTAQYLHVCMCSCFPTHLACPGVCQYKAVQEYQTPVCQCNVLCLQ